MRRNELCLCGGRTCPELTTLRRRVGGVRHRGPEVGTLAPEPDFTRLPAVTGRGVRRAGQDLGVPIGAGELKIWETGNLTFSPATQLARISEFQDSRISGFHSLRSDACGSGQDFRVPL